MRKYPVILIVLIFLVSFTDSQSQWIKAFNPFYGYVTAIAAIDSSVFAAADGNIYFSDNKGKTWTSISLTNQNANISSIIARGNEVFAATEGAGIFLSSDKGKKWTPVNSGLSTLNITAMTVKDSSIFAGTKENGIFFSSNLGQNWKHFNVEVSNSVKSIAVGDSIIIAGTDYGKVFISENYGHSWNSFYFTNILPVSVSSIIMSNGRIFVSSMGAGVYLSEDNGKLWKEANNGLYNSQVTSMIATDSGLFAGTLVSGVFRSTDYGTIWTPVNNGLGDSLVSALTFSDSTIIAGTENAKVFSSTDYGNQWSALNNNSFSMNINVLLVNGDDIFAGTQGDGVLFSSDQGRSWTSFKSGLTSLNITSLAVQDSTVYAATDYYGICKSSDYGKNWIPTKSINSIARALAVSDSVLYVTTDLDGFFRTTDKGESWENMGLKGNFLVPVAAKDSLVMTGSSIYKGVFLSTDYGVSWTSIGAPYAYSSVNSLGWCRGNIVAGIDYGIYFKADTVAKWIRKDPPKPNPNYVYCMDIKDSLIIAGTYDGIFFSDDWGDSWKNIDSGITGQIRAIAIIGPNIFAGGSNNNLWKRPVADVITAVKNKKPNIITSFSLEQNYPNPFNPVTKIRYSIPNVGTHGYASIQLKVYDVLGRKIAVLVNKKQQPGNYEVTFDGSKFSSGVYFYQLSIGNFVSTKKMILLK